MKKLLLGFIVMCFFQLSGYAQSSTPNSFHYQSILRDLTGSVISNESLGIQVSIIKNSASVDTIYTELHNVSSGYSGQIDLSIGSGNTTKGDFNTINWGTGSHSINVAIALGGGTDYSIINTQPLFSVPYALNSKTSGGVQNTRAACRDLLLNPAVGQIIFCSDCGVGETQVYNGTNWVTVTGDPTQPGSILVQKLSIEYNNTFTYDNELEEGSIPFTAIAWPDSAADKSVTWSTDNETVGVIDQNGVLVFKDTGVVFITAKSNDCGGAMATRSFNFLEDRPASFNVNFVRIYGDSAIFLNDSKQMLAALDSFQELDSFATWTSLDPDTVSITPDGVMTALLEGTARIVATASDFPTLKDTMTIYSRKRPEPFNPIFPTIVVARTEGQDVFIQRHDTLPFPEIFAIDYKEDTVSHTYELRDLSSNVVNYDSNTMGTTLLIVTASDSFSNTTVDTFNLIVGDRLAPVINIAGGLENGDTISSDNASSYTLPTATAIDEDGSSASVNIDGNGFQNTQPGQYILEYTATDANGNSVVDSIVLYMADSLAPTITFEGGITAGDTLIAGQNLAFSVPIAYAIDNGTDTLTYELLDGGLDVEQMGYYTLKYGAQDSLGNADSSMLTVYVVDNTPPEILDKLALEQEVINVVDSTPRKLVHVRATDNVGIASYELEWLPINENFDGQIWINDTGAIYMTDSLNSAFEASFFYRIRVTDSIGLMDSTTMEIVYTEGKLKDVRVKQFLDESWTNIGKAYSNPNPYSSILKYEYEVGDTVMFFTAISNAFTEFDTFELDATIPGAGSGDFTINRNGDIYYLTLNTAFDTAVQKVYNLKFNMRTRNTIDTTATVDIPIFINFDVQSVRTSNPELNNIIPTSVATNSIKLSDIMLIPTPSLGSIACPLSFANGIMGDLGNALDAAITSLPILPANTTRKAAKDLIRKLPAYFWLRNDGGIVRMNAKVPVKGKSVEIEYVSDNGDCYWVVLLDKLKLTSVNSRLSVLDADTKAGIIVTTKTITETNFDCIKLPCLKVGSGAHAVAIGNPLSPSGGNGFASALLDPSMIAIVTPLSGGFNDPNLKVTFAMKADFTTEFNKELLSRFKDGSAVAKASIGAARTGLSLAEGVAGKALSKLTGKNISLNQATAAYDKAVSTLSAAQDAANVAASALADATEELSKILTNDEICTPNVCIAPCGYLGWCSRWYGGYPCWRSCGCLVELREVCVPNPVAKVLGATFGREVMNDVRRTAVSTSRQVTRASAFVTYYSNPLNTAQAAVDAASTAYDAASVVRDQAQAALDAANIDAGQVGKVANYLIDNALGKSVSTSSITFETTLASVDNGTLSGQLTFDVSLLGAPKTTVTTPTISLTGANMETALTAVYNQLLNLIP